MSFLAPYMLWGALAAAVPVALHFLYRGRHRDVPWGAMRFLLAAVEQTRRRVRFRELLLLGLRVALVVLLAVALARPSSSAAGRGEDAVDAVLVVDTSLSIGARAGVAPPGPAADPYLSALRQFAGPDGGVTCLDRARAAALAVIAGLPPRSTVQVVASSDRAALLGPRVPSQLDQARPIVEGLALTHLATDYLPALRLGADLLRRGPSPGKELYLLSDMQRQGFDAQAAALASLFDEVRGGAAVFFVHCGPREVANVAVVGLTPQGPLQSGERADFAVLLRNTGKRPVRNLTVSLEADGISSQRETRPVALVRPGETRAVVLPALLGRPGRHVLSAAVRPDDLEGDNRLDQVFHVADQAGVLVVDGAPDERDPSRSASYFLRHALDPVEPGERGGLPVTVVAAGRAAPRDLGGKELCLLVNVALEPVGKGAGDSLSPDFLRALANFVAAGRPLALFAGDRVEPGTYNRLLFEQLRLLPYRIAGVESAPAGRPWTVDRHSAGGPPFRRFRDEEGYAGLGRIEARRLLALESAGAEAQALAGESRVPLRYSGGPPAVASRKRPGQGEVLLFTTSVSDPAWSDWFVSPAFVPFVQVLLQHLLEARPAALNRTAGEPLVWPVPDAEAATRFDLVLPGGERRRLGFPQAGRGRLLLTATDLTTAGVYRLVPAGGEVTGEAPLFAVSPDLRETEDLEYLTPGQIDARLGDGLVHLTAGDDGSAFSGTRRLGREWTPWLLAALLALLVGEMLLAWHCGRAC
jgi:hypothetical protein